MTSTEEDGSGGSELLKVDTKGRVRVSRERREELLAEYDRSSMSGAAFAEWAGIKYPTLMYWLAERRRGEQRTGAHGAGAASELSWVEAVVEEDRTSRSEPGGGGAAALLKIALPGGVSLRVGSPAGAALAAEVMRHLGVGGRC